MEAKVFKPSTMTVDQIGDLLVVKAQAVADAYVDWASKEAQYTNLLRFNKTLLYKFMPEVVGEKKLTEEGRKKIAYTHPDYIAHLEGESAAYTAKMEAEAVLKSQQTKYETLKSVLLKKYGTVA